MPLDLELKKVTYFLWLAWNSFVGVACFDKHVFSCWRKVLRFSLSRYSCLATQQLLHVIYVFSTFLRVVSYTNSFKLDLDCAGTFHTVKEAACLVNVGVVSTRLKIVINLNICRYDMSCTQKPLGAWKNSTEQTSLMLSFCNSLFNILFIWHYSYLKSWILDRILLAAVFYNN